MLLLILFTTSTDSEIIFGLTFDTALPDPINSGGSIAIISGDNFAISSTSVSYTHLTLPTTPYV